MHGRKKRIEPLSKEEQQVLSVKAKTYKSLMEIIQTRRKAGDASAETFILTSKHDQLLGRSNRVCKLQLINACFIIVSMCDS